MSGSGLCSRTIVWIDKPCSFESTFSSSCDLILIGSLFVELIIGRKINPKAESIINTVGFILLILLMILITIKDLFIK